jgi:hypothetical protein
MWGTNVGTCKKALRGEGFGVRSYGDDYFAMGAPTDFGVLR